MKCIGVQVFAETWAKLERQKTANKGLTRCIAPLRVAPDVPNQPATDRTQLCVRIPRTLKKRLEKLAKRREITLTELIELMIQRQVATVELTPNDYREIARDIERAAKR